MNNGPTGNPVTAGVGRPYILTYLRVQTLAAAAEESRCFWKKPVEDPRGRCDDAASAAVSPAPFVQKNKSCVRPG